MIKTKKKYALEYTKKCKKKHALRYIGFGRWVCDNCDAIIDDGDCSL